MEILLFVRMCLKLFYQITPEDTPFYNMIGDSEAMSTKHEWQIRSLSTRNDNAQVEGHTFVHAAPVLPTRVSNLTQIIARTARVARSSASSSRHAIGDLVADQTEQRMIEWKTDAEHAAIAGSQASGNASDSARRMNGLIASITTTATSFSSGTTFEEDHLNDMLNAIWNQGGKPRDVLVNGFLKRRISSFTGNAQKQFMQQERQVVNTIPVYESDFGTVSVQLSRDIPGTSPTNTIVALDRSLYTKSWLDTPFAERSPKVADSTDVVILGEFTLEYGNEAAAGKYENVS